MDYQANFRRYEIKYVLTDETRGIITDRMAPYMLPDRFAHSSIRNIYFDTDSFLLIRRSIEKPIYKEKLRLRSYGRALEDSRVFFEVKKKYKSEVYKRRVAVTEKEALCWVESGVPPREPENTQISREINYLISFYQTLAPKVFLSYERDSYYSPADKSLRITFDNNICASTNSLSLHSDPHGASLLGNGLSLMEIKCAGGMPLWLTALLSEQKIYKTSFSKYGTAYQYLILPNTFHKKGDYLR